jgi:hypothetical protein
LDWRQPADTIEKLEKLTALKMKAGRAISQNGFGEAV